MNNSSNSTQIRDTFEEALSKNVSVVLCGLFIFYINGTLVRVYFSVPSFSQEARYVLYIFLVVNDMLLVKSAVLTLVLTYKPRLIRVPGCYILVFTSGTAFRNTPLILAGMAVERFIAVCLPLHHGRICTPHRARVYNAIAWCVSSIPGLADLFQSLRYRPLQFYTSEILCYHTILFSSPLHQVIRGVGNGICMAFVWMTLFYTYVRVICTARAASSKGQAEKAQRTILLHAGQLLLCMLSYISPPLDQLLVTMFPMSTTNVLFGTFVVTNLLPRVLSPLIYGIRDQAFKKHIKGALLCRRDSGTKVHI